LLQRDGCVVVEANPAPSTHANKLKTTTINMYKIVRLIRAKSAPAVTTTGEEEGLLAWVVDTESVPCALDEDASFGV
jgi:hypothetical protein